MLQVFQNSKCSASGQPLELPVVHFYCGHSFNQVRGGGSGRVGRACCTPLFIFFPPAAMLPQRSLGDSDAECPICAPDFRRMLDIRRNMAASATQQVGGPPSPPSASNVPHPYCTVPLIWCPFPCSTLCCPPLTPLPSLPQDRFFTELREHGDGFTVVAEHFGRGIMNLTAAATRQD